MKPEHIIQAITDTARAFFEVDQNVCDALRGIVARAGRYEAKDTDPTEEKKINDALAVAELITVASELDHLFYGDKGEWQGFEVLMNRGRLLTPALRLHKAMQKINLT